MGHYRCGSPLEKVGDSLMFRDDVQTSSPDKSRARRSEEGTRQLYLYQRALVCSGVVRLHRSLIAPTQVHQSCTRAGVEVGPGCEHGSNGEPVFATQLVLLA